MKRIPHHQEAIKGQADVKQYVQSHQNAAQYQFAPFLQELKRLNIQGRYLEIGSGPGFLTAEIAKQNSEVDIIAVELSKEMVEFGQSHVAALGLKDQIHFVYGNANDPSLMEDLGKFDLVFSAFSLHHWENPQQTILTLHDTVTPGGTLWIHDLKRVFWLYLFPIKNGFFSSIRAAYTKNELSSMLNKTGLSDYRITSPFPYFIMNVSLKK